MKKKYFTFFGFVLGCLFVFTQAHSQVTVTSVSTDITCHGYTNGAIDITPSGGSGVYTYDWTTGASTEDVDNLAVGSYSVTVTENLSETFDWAPVNTGGNASIMVQVGVVSIDGQAPVIGDYIGVFCYDLTATTGNLFCCGYSQWGGSNTNIIAYGNDAGVVATPEKDGFAEGELIKFKYFQVSTGFVFDMTPIYNPIFGTLTTYNVNNLYVLDSLYGTVPVPQYAVHTAMVGDPGEVNPNGTVTNATFSGASNGAIDLNVLGGTPSYSYLWNDASILEDRTGLVAGTYMVTVTDDNSCTGSAEYTVSEPSAVALSASITDVTCFGGTNGAIDLTVTGGTTPYTVVWNTSVTAEDLSGLSASTQNVVVTDAGGFVASGSYTVNQAPEITLAAALTHVTCNGGSNGAIDVTVTNGVASLAYNWNPASITEDLSSVEAGDYHLTVTDIDGCTAMGNWTLTEPTAITLSFGVTSISTFGASDGSINLIVSGGTPIFTYNWSTGAVTEDISGLPTGLYQVTVTDANTCTKTGEAFVSDVAPSAFVATGTQTNLTCFGVCDGSIDVSATGGILPYSYTWAHGGTTADLSGICAGNYTVTVSDGSGNVTNTFDWTYTITEPTSTHLIVIPPTGITIDGQAPVGGDYFGLFYNLTTPAPNGDTVACGGYLQYPFVAGNTSITAWGTESGMNNGFAIGETFKWKYFRNSDGAEIDLAATYAPAFSIPTIENEGLYAPNGTSFITALTGISSPPPTAQTQVLNFTITEPAEIVVTGSQTNVSCNGGSDGTASVSVTGGTPPYTYDWTPGSPTGDGTESISGLTAGDWTCEVTDASFCTAQLTITITEPDVLAISGSLTFISCYGLSDGAIDATVTGGTTPYAFAWSNSAATEDISGLSVGTFTLTVTDDNGCTAENSFTIMQPSALMVSGAVTHLLCYHDNTGSIDLTASGGSLPYAYLWSNTSTDEDQNGVAAGSYSVVVTDANGCTVSASFNVTEPAEFSASGTVTDVDCYGAATGSVDLAVVGGTAPVLFAWSNSTANEDLMAVTAGFYNVAVTDDNNCALNLDFNINEPAELMISASVENVSCNGLSNGSIEVTVNGGTTAYSFSWLSGSSMEDRDNLAAGTYFLTVTDAHGCMKDASFTVTEPAVLASSGVETNLLCNGDGNGAVDFTVDGGTMPYTYLWSDSSTDEDLAGLSGGTFEVTVSDDNGCITTNSFSIFEPTALLVSGTASDALCFGAADGEIDLTVSDGTPTYTILWSNGAQTEDVSGLIAGNYDVTVTDANGCYEVGVFTIDEPAELTISNSVVNLYCNGDTDGSINLTVSGGTAPYAYIWGNLATTEDQSGLSAGVYYVTVTDDHSCSSTAMITLYEPDALALTSTLAHVSILWGSDGAINIDVTGGILPYDYVWSNMAVSEDLNFIVADTYTVTVTDDNGCVLVRSFVINQPPDNPGWSYTNTGINHTILIPDYASLIVEGSPLIPGDYIGVFYDSLGTPACGGYLLYAGITDGLAAWGAQSGMTDGFADGEEFTWKVWKALQNTEHDVNAIYMPIGINQITHQEFFAAQGMSGITALEDVQARQYIEVNAGWGIISSYVVAEYMEMDSIFFDIVANVGLLKNDMGASYWPIWGVNQIGSWQSEEGYKLFMLAADTLVIAGDQVDPLLTPIHLPYGWSLMGHLLSTPADPASIFAPILGMFDLVKDGAGHVYWPLFSLNSMGNMMPDKGYAIFTNTATTLYFPAGPTSIAKSYNMEIDTKYYGKPANTGANMIVGIPVSAWDILPGYGDEVAVFNAHGQLVGSSVFANTAMAIAVWGDNDQTNAKDGLLENETFELKIYKQTDKSEQSLFVSWTQGRSEYETDAIAVAGKVAAMETFTNNLGQNMPNPVNSITEIEYSLGTDANVEISIYNILGSELEVLVSESQLAGTYKVQFDARNLPAGTYFYKLRTEDFEAVKKMNVVR